MDMGVNRLPEHLEHARSRVTLGPKHPQNTEGIYYSGAYAASGYDNSLDLARFQREFRIQIIQKDKDTLVFDLIGADPPIANALRRILLAEVPTMAIERVIIYDNTSIIHDEMLAHRLGLIPLQVDPRHFEFEPQILNSSHNQEQTCQGSEPDQNRKICPESELHFRLQISCTKNTDLEPSSDSTASNLLYHNAHVYSKSIEWIPIGDQANKFVDDPPRPVHDDILIAKLRPGQNIDVLMHAIKGMGSIHAKWSPAATAFYRMLPEITFKNNLEIVGDDAKVLVNKCPLKVFDLEDLGHQLRAKVARPRDCTMCRECIRESSWDERIQLTRVKNHFIFSVESTGCLPPEVLVSEALDILSQKCTNILDVLETQNYGHLASNPQF